MSEQVWMIYPANRFNQIEFTSKNAAYRMCRTLNGKKSGGKRHYHIQRKHLMLPTHEYKRR